MWRRRISLSGTSRGLVIEDFAVEGPTCRLGAALVRFGRPAAGVPATSATLVGAAWRDDRGNTRWGWPGENGEIVLRESAQAAAACALLPPAVSLALSLRRAGVEIGARALVAGAGTPARIARVVALGCGCRLVEDGTGGPTKAAGGASPDLVIVATDDKDVLERALAGCRSWGSVFSFGVALLSGPLDYYSDIHRRALCVHSVPLLPGLLPGEEDRIERGQSNLARALADTPGPGGPVVPVSDRDGAPLGDLATDEDGAWGLLVTRET